MSGPDGRLDVDVCGDHRMLAELARRQDGVVTRPSCWLAASGANAIDHRLKTGRLHLLHRGVYAAGHPAARAEARRGAA